jgi:MFS family permease
MTVSESATPGVGELLAPHDDAYAALRLPNVRLYLAGNMMSILAQQMQTVAVGWEIYERTGSELALGWVGLVQFMPVIALALPAGQTADRYQRKHIIMLAMLAIAACSLGLAWVSARQGSIYAMYGCLLASGVARAFQQPAKASFLPQIVPREHFGNAVAWNLGGFQIAAVAGPALSGYLIWLFGGAKVVYLVDAALSLGFCLLLTMIVAPRFVRSVEAVTARGLAAGVGFVLRNKIILAALTLDMFAVLLGGATTLLPVFAKNILDVGPDGLGWLRAAPAAGALLMSLGLAHRPPARAGRALVLAVVGFGLATIVFGFSRSFWLSLAMLFLTGVFDSISVVVRHTLVQMLTPDAMRGRVSAINGMFIGASNELGGFESGVVAHWFNPTVSVVSGGLGTLVVVAIVGTVWPQLRRYGRLDGKAEGGRG